MVGKPARVDAAGSADDDVLCADESSARAEATRRQASETEGAEWIYLKRDRDQQWVARRWIDRGEDASGSKLDVVGEVVLEALNPFNWFQP